MTQYKKGENRKRYRWQIFVTHPSRTTYHSFDVHLCHQALGYVWSFGENTHRQLGLTSQAITDTTSMYAASQSPSCVAASSSSSSSPYATVTADIQSTIIALSTDSIITAPHRITTFVGRNDNDEDASRNSTFDCSLVCAGWTHSLASGVDKRSGTYRTYGWGDNRYQQCGIEHSSPQANLPFPSRIPTLDGIIIDEMRCGWKHSIVRCRDGRVFVWGDNAHGQKGLK